MKLSLEQVRHVAELARLALTPEEEERYRQQLSAILEAVEKLDELDTRLVQPTSHSTLVGQLFREDEPRPGLEAEKALANARQRLGTSFAVPRFVE